MSRLGGFDCVPVTVFVDGPLGPGSLQAWVEVDEEATGALVDLVPTSAVPGEGWFAASQGLDADDRPVTVIHADVPELRLLAVFDVLINNADRKGGHILGSGGRVFGVDHGVSFHTDHKLRTLLWGWAGAELNETRVDGRAPGAGSRPRSARASCSASRRSRRSSGGPTCCCTADGCRAPRGEWPSIPWPPF